MSGQPRVRRRARLRGRGQATVELALIMPVALSLLLLVTDVGRMSYTYIGVTNAAREGAAYGMWHPTCWSNGNGTNQCPDPANITYLARQELSGDAALTVTVSCADACASATSAAGNTITVSAERVFTFLFPMIPAVTLRVTSQAVIQ